MNLPSINSRDFKRLDLATMAEIAGRRLARINQEFQGKKETPGVKLGVYEQNVGLRTGLPRQL